MTSIRSRRLDRVDRLHRIDRLVAPWALHAPNRVAIDAPGEVMTYRQLDELANRFARALLAHGVVPGDRVGVHVPRSGRAVAAMLGASRAGAVYVPLDPGSPPARMRLIAEDCGLRHVVMAPALLGAWIAAGVKGPVEHVFLSDAGEAAALPGAFTHAFADVAAQSPAALPPPGVSPDELAYILYTSGSTGVPKGVMISHRNALSFVHWAADEIALLPTDRVASVAPFHFDLSVFDVWATLSRGAAVVVVDEAAVLSGRRMAERIAEAEISVWYSVPSALVLMLESGALGPGRAPSLRVVFFAGEVFPMKHLRRVMAALPQARFYNLFGPTETNVCTAYALPEVLPDDQTSIPIGWPCCGDECVVVVETGQTVRAGEIGELLVDGPTVMMGYWEGGKRAPTKRPYATGDLVSRRADGALMYHGRRDHMVKIHGFRIELGEVESALHAHPGIQEALAFAIDQSLVAVAVPATADVSVLEIKRHCAARLPKYMIPADVRLVAALPRTSSGKADRVRTKTAAAAGDVDLLKPVARPPARKEP